MKLARFVVGLTLSVAAWGQAQEAKATPPGDMEERWGVRVESIRLSAADYMVDFRYRVLNVEKARPLSLRQIKPYLIAEASGEKLEVPRPPTVGPLRSTYEPEANRVYGILFGNTYKRLKRGEKVTVVIGDFRAENLTLE